MKISKLLLIMSFLLNMPTSYGMFEFDALTERLCDHLCQGELVKQEEFVGWISCASQKHLTYVSNEYNFATLDEEQREELFEALCTIIEGDIPNEQSRASFKKAIRSLGDRMYASVAILFGHMPKNLLNQ